MKYYASQCDLNKAENLLSFLSFCYIIYSWSKLCIFVWASISAWKDHNKIYNKIGFGLGVLCAAFVIFSNPIIYIVVTMIRRRIIPWSLPAYNCFVPPILLEPSRDLGWTLLEIFYLENIVRKCPWGDQFISFRLFLTTRESAENNECEWSLQKKKMNIMNVCSQYFTKTVRKPYKLWTKISNYWPILKCFLVKI